jgi:hypothetical protein
MTMLFCCSPAVRLEVTLWEQEMLAKQMVAASNQMIFFFI